MEKEDKPREARGGVGRHETQQEDPASRDESRQVKLSPDIDVERGCGFMDVEEGGGCGYMDVGEGGGCGYMEVDESGVCGYVDVEVERGCGRGLEEESEPGKRALCQILEVNSQLGEPGRLRCHLREISNDELSQGRAEVGQGQQAHCELRHWAVLTILLTIVILSLLKLFLSWLTQAGHRTEDDSASQPVLQSTRTV